MRKRNHHSSDALEYERVAIPDAAVQYLGDRVALSDLVIAGAVLLLLPGGDVVRAERSVARWEFILPKVRSLIVAPQYSAIPSTPRVLVDRDGRLGALFDRGGAEPAAVLLGADRLLAGGPVYGWHEIEQLVDAARLQFRLHESPEVQDGTYRPISAKCITYGRIRSLEESVESFLRQDYSGDSELVVVNDYPRQKLRFEHPRVRIYNLDFTFRTIGEKENFAVSACQYPTIAVWDDDDIALPNHLSNINRYMGERHLLHWQRGIALVGGEIRALGSLGNSGIVYTRDAWERIGGHPLENAGYDVTLVNRILALGGPPALAEPPHREVSWAYNWGDGTYHMSGLGTDDDSRPNVIVRHSEHIEQLRRAGRIPVGEIALQPHWTKNYAERLVSYCDQEGC